MKNNKALKNLDSYLRLVKVLIYFRVNNLKPTLVKTGRFLINGEKEDLGEILTRVNDFNQDGKISEEKGTYQWELTDSAPGEKGKMSLTGKVGTKKLSVEKQKKLAVSKMKKTLFVMKFLRHLPGIKMIALSGTVAAGNPKPQSDLDFLVVTRDGRIWTTRFLMLLVLELLGARKKGEKRANRVCLNQFVNERSMEMKYKDIYTALEYSQMVCLVDRDQTWSKFWENNQWVKKYLRDFDWQKRDSLPGYWQEQIMGEGLNNSLTYRFLNYFFSMAIFDYLEQFLGNFQAKRIQRKRSGQLGGQVYWGDDALIFHPKPKSVSFSVKYQSVMLKEKPELEKRLKLVIS